MWFVDFIYLEKKILCCNILFFLVICYKKWYFSFHRKHKRDDGRERRSKVTWTVVTDESSSLSVFVFSINLSVSIGNSFNARSPDTCYSEPIGFPWNKNTREFFSQPICVHEYHGTILCSPLILHFDHFIFFDKFEWFVFNIWSQTDGFCPE